VHPSTLTVISIKIFFSIFSVLFLLLLITSIPFIEKFLIFSEEVQKLLYEKRDSIKYPNIRVGIKFLMIFGMLVSLICCMDYYLNFHPSTMIIIASICFFIYIISELISETIILRKYSLITSWTEIFKPNRKRSLNKKDYIIGLLIGAVGFFIFFNFIHLLHMDIVYRYFSHYVFKE